jgi:uncharacterized SAM-binding protein YcdF (DUF218 family)
MPVMYKLVVQLLDPFTFLLLGLAAATVCQWRRQKPRSWGLKIAGSVVGIIIIVSTPLAGDLALASLESSVLPAEGVPGRADSIVVLSAGLRFDDEAGESARLDESSMNRCLQAARLYRQAGRCRIILTGGKLDPNEPGPTYAAAMRDFLRELGIPLDDMLLEEKASSTFENALFTRPILDRDGTGRVWLVTDASHMPRARGCFRALGIDVLPAPCNYLSRGWRLESTSFLPSSSGAARFSRASHEWLGRIWYRLRGRN